MFPAYRLLAATLLGGSLCLSQLSPSFAADSATRDLITRARHAGLEVHVWTVNSIPEMNKMLGLGVDQIITDDPKLLGQVIKERAALSQSELTLLLLADIAENRISIR